MVVGSWSVSTHTFLGPAYEGGGHLLSLTAFPSNKYTQGVFFLSWVDSEAAFLKVNNSSPRWDLNSQPQDP